MVHHDAASRWRVGPTSSGRSSLGLFLSHSSKPTIPGFTSLTFRRSALYSSEANHSTIEPNSFTPVFNPFPNNPHVVGTGLPVTLSKTLFISSKVNSSPASHIAFLFHSSGLWNASAAKKPMSLVAIHCSGLSRPRVSLSKVMNTLPANPGERLSINITGLRIVQPRVLVALFRK
ncbi:uncharacterized protein QC761_0027190 [Podospora bellae-mahoneyi]|uniref:Uncharacterized protein n=1 Tax=Podospora bellae-mahoneyi TaxID=2093777 RepID=A0ABR0FW93_9PEZI|nr:hypothetical protein QC761_0027190 [Podospora bellae-mahoneyi]